jgi:hypothetical protein
VEPVERINQSTKGSPSREHGRRQILRALELTKENLTLILYALFVLTLLWASWSSAQTPPPTPQFAFVGFIQAATLDTTAKICTPAPQLADVNDRNSQVNRLKGNLQ